MPNFTPVRFLLLAAALTAGAAGAASAQDVQSGIAAWQAGDYAGAVAQWRPLADAGNADAQFNLGQAYRLGRGVPQNVGLAEQWFEKAARQRHEQAGSALGLLLFQNGRAREAMPWIQAAANRGDPRAQYVFGTALFNGDIVRRDLPRAYAMMSAAAGQGFPQAQTQLADMERQLSAQDRERGRQLAQQISPPAPQQLAEAGRSVPAPVARPPVPSRPAREPREAAPGRPDAGVSYAPPPEDARPTRIADAEPRGAAPAPAEPRRVPGPPRIATPTPAETAPRPAASGNWRVQLGAFSSAANARRQWDAVRRRVAALGPLQPSFTTAGPLTRLRAGPLTSRAAADQICASVRAAGEACLPVPR